MARVSMVNCQFLVLFLCLFQSFLQLAEFMFNDILREVGGRLNNTLEAMPVISTIKHILRGTARNLQV